MIAPLPSVCVSGMGIACAAGLDSQTVWHTLCAGTQHRVAATILHKDALDYPFFAVPDSVFGSGRRFSAHDTLQLSIVAAEQALKQAHILPQQQGAMHVVMGTTAGSALHFLAGYTAMREKKAGIYPDVEEYFTSNLALSLAQRYSMHGTALTIANACTSGADALGLAADMIAQGECKQVLCGGADALSLVPHTGFARLMIYSKTACRPFDAERQGLNLGEGAGMLILEETEHALARGVRPLGYIAGYGAASDAHHFTAPHPQARGLQKAVALALHNAGITAEDIAFINAHGTATQENDKVEGNFFMQHFAHKPVWGSKSCTGHTLGAAGALEAIFCLLALQKGSVPATHGFANPDPQIKLCPTQKNTAIHSSYALSTSLGFGGGNAALILAGAQL